MRQIDGDALEERFADSYNGCAGECECCKHYLREKWRKGWCGLIANAPTVATDTNDHGQWISVKNDLPKEHDSIFANLPHLDKHMWAKESDNVIVYVRFPDGTGRSTEGRLQDGKWWTRISPTLKPVVTHWQPFHEPPKVVSGDE